MRIYKSVVGGGGKKLYLTILLLFAIFMFIKQTIFNKIFI